MLYISGMDAFLFINPLPGRYGRRRIAAVTDSLASAGIYLKVFSVNTPGDALPHCCAIKESSENPLVIVAAGDDTVNAVVKLAMEKSDTSRELLRLPVERLEIKGTKPIQIDGDFVGYSPARIRMLPDFARIIT